MDRRAAQLRRRRWLFLHLVVDGIVFGLFVVVWVLAMPSARRYTGAADTSFWPGWIALLLVIPLALHTLYVLSRGPLRTGRIERDLDRDGPGAATGWLEQVRLALGGRERPAGELAAAPRPTGQGRRVLATVLFTDIVGSTERARQLGDLRWGELLDLHDRTTRELVGRWGGRVVKLTGDGVLATFDGPDRAIRCAGGLRERLRAAGIQIRAGLHTGEVVVRGRDVGGIAVHIGARVMAAAGGDEILLSRTVHDLVAGTDLRFQDRGTHQLKGVEGSWQLYAVAAG